MKEAKRDELFDRIDRACENTKYLKAFLEKHDRIVILGFGSCAALASQTGQDIEKAFPSKLVLVPTDTRHVTGLSAEHGQNNLLQHLVKKHVTEKGTLVILISARGDVEMVSRAAYHCAENFIPTIILTGCPASNKLEAFDFPSRILSVLVESEDEKIVEIAISCLFMAALDK